MTGAIIMVDGHVHAWHRWPWPGASSPESQGRAEQLVKEMDQAGIARAVVICARLNGNDDNNAYVAAEAEKYPGRLIPFADIDSRWTPEHRMPGAGARLRVAVERFRVAGFTHYLDEDEDAEWLADAVGTELFATAAELGLIASIAAMSRHLTALLSVAERYASLPVLLHHMGGIRIGAQNAETGLFAVLAAARLPNIFLKISGFAHTDPSGAFPYADQEWLAREFYSAFGPERLIWGSDFPVVTRAMSYPQALEVVQQHYRFLSEAERGLLFGGNLQRLFADRKVLS
ncbi:amidohydrolase family protein [Chelativorans sp.]|uniref:amidohydrolase family protein n=1 Tax=Chelativorans sp. TaxID=2203393 RepID=UPI0028120059|nr:amidohydrolase family protein [Chelativorans sp.]